MTLGLLGWLLALGAPLVLGATVLLACGIVPRGAALAFVARAWCAGALVMGATVGTLLLLGQPPRMFVLLPPLLAIGGVLAIVAALRARADRDEADGELALLARDRPKPPRRPWLLGAVALVAALLVADRVLVSLGTPLLAGPDGAARDARLVFEAGGSAELFRGDAARLAVAVPDGPAAFEAPLSGLLQAWIFAVADRPTWFENRAPPALFAVLLPLLVAGALAGRARVWIAAVPVLLLAGMEPLAREALDAGSATAVAAGLVLALDGWQRWRAGEGGGWFAVSMVGAALCAAARQEALVVLVAFAVGAALDLALAARREPRSACLPATWLPWLLLPLSAAAAAAALAHWGGSPGDLERAPRTIGEVGVRSAALAKHAFDWVLLVPSHARLVPLALALVVLARPRAAVRGPRLALLAALAVGTLLVLARAIADAAPVGPELLARLSRELFQLVPAAAVLLGLLLDDAWSTWRRARELDD